MAISKSITTKLILASTSPRRRQLMELLGVPFIVHACEIDETYDSRLKPQDVVMHLAREKALQGLSDWKRDDSGPITDCSDAIVIGADTVVVLDEMILGKPLNSQDAFRMLRLLQHREHEVYTGICCISSKTNRQLVDYRRTSVNMLPMTDDQIRDYVDTKEPLDKAGSYAIQGLGAVYVESISGCYYNVVGMPLSLLAEMIHCHDPSLLQRKRGLDA